jgi:hypothetical protein
MSPDEFEIATPLATNRSLGTGSTSDDTKLTTFLRQYSFDDLAKAFFTLHLWLPNIASPVKLQYAHVTLESICTELANENRLHSYDDLKQFCGELFELLPSFESLEDFLPETDWGEIEYFFDERRYKIFYGGELTNSYDFYYGFEIVFSGLDDELKRLTGRSPLAELRLCLQLQNEILQNIQQPSGRISN